mgnify:CR=1 FL=1
MTICYVILGIVVILLVALLLEIRRRTAKWKPEKMKRRGRP